MRGGRGLQKKLENSNFFNPSLTQKQNMLEGFGNIVPGMVKDKVGVNQVEFVCRV